MIPKLFGSGKCQRGDGVRVRGDEGYEAPKLAPYLWIGAFGLLVAGLVVARRNARQKMLSERRSDEVMPGLQKLAILVLGISGAEIFLFWLVPHTLLILSSNFEGIYGRLVVSITAGSGIIGAVGAFVVKRWGARLLRTAVGVVIAVAGPLFLLVPFIGFTYWNAQWGTMWSHDGLERAVLAGVSVASLLWLLLRFDEVTSTAHLFYRERLATAFVGFRRADDEGQFHYDQPKWTRPLLLSQAVAPWLGAKESAAKMPNLVICAAANLSEAPVGRLGASFTFEADKIGGPTTGYVPTPWIERHAEGGAGTLPGLMAISGAAIAPAMGKMTLPGLRFLMAVFNLRLGVWLPNPYRAPWKLSASQIRRGIYPMDMGATDEAAGRRVRPGGFYVFREAFGRNTVKRPFVYVTDGGHWENLGLVELLRRGCGRVVVLDGSGGKNEWFDTLSEAIALARADLGVDIDIDLGELRADPETGRSAAAFAVGRILYPNATKGTLIYVRALIPEDAPPEIKSYAARDKKYPNHPTSDQFFGDITFEAYRSLGTHLMQRAIDCGWFGRTPAERADPSGWPNADGTRRPC